MPPGAGSPRRHRACAVCPGASFSVPTQRDRRTARATAATVSNLGCRLRTPRTGMRSRVRLSVGGLVGVEFVGARPKVLRGRPMLGGTAAFVLGRELLLFGAGGSLVRGRGLPVGFALGSGRVASGLRGR